MAGLIVNGAFQTGRSFSDRNLIHGHAGADHPAEVEVAADRRDHVPAVDDAWAFDVAGVHRFFQFTHDPGDDAEVTGVADRREAIVQDFFTGRYADEGQCGVVEGCEVRDDLRTAGEMDMGVDKARHHKFRGQVDDFGVRRARDAFADCGDLAVDDEDFRRALRCIR